MDIVMDLLYHPPIRILLVDSVQRVRDAVHDLLNLQQDMQVVGEAADPSTTLALVEQLAPDLTLLDLRLPDADGLYFLAALHRTHPYMILVLYAANPRAGAPEAALRAGAACFIEKGASPQTFLQALRRAARRPRSLAGIVALEGDSA